MDAEGYVGKRGKGFTISTVQNILKNEFIYRGKLKYEGEVYEGTHPHIL